MPQHGFFDVDRRLESISRMGDPLERLAAEIPWELFRPVLEKVRGRAQAVRRGVDVQGADPADALQPGRRGGGVPDSRPALVLFMRFLGLEMYDSAPDGTTVWRFRERLKELELIKPLFDRFGDYLAQAGLEARNGQIIDAAIIAAPIQRNSREDNRRIKAGEVPEDWEENKRRHKDTDARWTQKHGKSHFGYKNHIDTARFRWRRETGHGRRNRCHMATPPIASWMAGRMAGIK